MRVLILFMLSGPLHATEFVSPAPFQTRHCFEYLSSPEAREKTQAAMDWLNNLKPMTMAIMKWHVRDGEGPSPATLNPRIVFFEADPNSAYEHVIRRYQEAQREADRYSQTPTPTVVREQTRDLRSSPALEAPELAALGFTSDDLVSSDGLSAHVQATGGALVFSVENTEGAKSQFRLRIRDVTHGFDNAVAAWEAATLDSHTEPPQPTFEEAAKPDLMRRFFGAHGRFALTRKAAGWTFAYVFDRRMLKATPDGTSNFDLTIYRVGECDLDTMMSDSEVIMPRRSNQKYSCLVPLGLRLMVPSETLDPMFPGTAVNMRQTF